MNEQDVLDTLLNGNNLEIALVDWLISKGKIPLNKRDEAISRMIEKNQTIDQMTRELSTRSYPFKNVRETYIAHDKLTKQLSTEVFVATRLSKKKKKATAIVTMELFDENGVELSKPLSMFDLTVLQAVYSILDAGNDRCTTFQIYQKMRGNSDVAPNKMVEDSLQQIDKAMWKLQSVIVSLKCEDENGRDSKAARTWLGITKVKESLISFVSAEYQMYGKTVTGYVFKGIESSVGVECLPIFYRLSKAMHHYEVVSDNVINIKKISPKTGSESTVRLTNQRATIVKYLLDFVLTFKRSNGHVSNKKPYDTIFNDCDIEITSRMMNKRIKEFIQIVLEHFKRNKLIDGYGEYNKGRGIQIQIKEKE